MIWKDILTMYSLTGVIYRNCHSFCLASNDKVERQKHPFRREWYISSPSLLPSMRTIVEYHFLTQMSVHIEFYETISLEKHDELASCSHSCISYRMMVKPKILSVLGSIQQFLMHIIAMETFWWCPGFQVWFMHLDQLYITFSWTLVYCLGWHRIHGLLCCRRPCWQGLELKLRQAQTQANMVQKGTKHKIH